MRQQLLPSSDKDLFKCYIGTRSEAANVLLRDIEPGVQPARDAGLFDTDDTPPVRIPIGDPRYEDYSKLCRLLEQLTEESDVLDTRFSSALWPFSTLGWPEKTDHLKQYYPGSVLITSRDIITNWVARMVMFGLYAMGDVLEEISRLRIESDDVSVL